EVLHFEEKNRVGSVPPICHNKCNGCHPCIPVQVSTWPSNGYGRRFQPRVAPTAANKEGFLFEDHNSYSNYKPLDWKCRCGDHFFNP
ncbi:hypothetical protein PIB30_050918, partial [Stylosanthes scabra]|nr:hypothetical protein [Stylosanthes scabra]